MASGYPPYLPNQYGEIDDMIRNALQHGYTDPFEANAQAQYEAQRQAVLASLTNVGHLPVGPVAAGVPVAAPGVGRRMGPGRPAGVSHPHARARLMAIMAALAPPSNGGFVQVYPGGGAGGFRQVHPGAGGGGYAQVPQGPAGAFHQVRATLPWMLAR